MGSAITVITFPYFLTDKERYNLLDCFRMRIIEESRLENPAFNQKLCEMIRNFEKRCVDCEEKEIKICIRHSQKNLRHNICYTICVVFKGVFRTQLNIHDGAFLQKQLTAFGS